jgi:uncharacterized protein (TIGR00725 family)
MYITVAGASECPRELLDLAYQVGTEIAKRGHVMVCGGLGGVMDAAARGVHDEDGTSVGILPDSDRARASKWLSVSIPTDLGHARNTLVVLSGDAVIAVGGSYGTLSEIAFGLKMGKPVIGLQTWELERRDPRQRGLIKARTAAEAVDLAEQLTLT